MGLSGESWFNDTRVKCYVMSIDRMILRVPLLNSLTDLVKRAAEYRRELNGC